MPEIYSRPPGWLEVLGLVSLVLAVGVAGYISYDIFVRGHHQKMAIMEIVYPVSALYLGPGALWFYVRHAGKGSHRGGAEDTDIRWWQVAEAVSHCGAGCTLGDIGAEWLVFGLGSTIAATALYADLLFDFVFAWTLGIIFQYFTIVPMRQLNFLEGLWAAVRADTLSIVAFQVGLFAGMFVYQRVLFTPPLPKTTPSYWFLMQLSMVVGFMTAYPVVRWLIAKGWKERM